MIPSLLANPIAWWPLGLVIGAVIGGLAHRGDRRRPRPDDPTDDADRRPPPGPVW